jgi:hypothetical protein
MPPAAKKNHFAVESAACSLAGLWMLEVLALVAFRWHPPCRLVPPRTRNPARAVYGIFRPNSQNHP